MPTAVFNAPVFNNIIRLNTKYNITDGYISTDKYDYIIDNYTSTDKLRPSTAKLLLYGAVILTDLNKHKKKTAPITTQCTITIDGYKTIRDVTSAKKLQKELTSDLNALNKLMVSERGNNYIYICTGRKVRSGVILEFNEQLLNAMMHTGLIYLPVALFTTDDRNPNLLPLAYKLITLYQLKSNQQYKRAGTVSVKTCLNNCPAIDTEHREHSKRIITPLLNALNEIQHLGIIQSWYILDNDGITYTTKQIKKLSVTRFKQCKISYKMYDFTDCNDTN